MMIYVQPDLDSTTRLLRILDERFGITEVIWNIPEGSFSWKLVLVMPSLGAIGSKVVYSFIREALEAIAPADIDLNDVCVTYQGLGYEPDYPTIQVR